MRIKRIGMKKNRYFTLGFKRILIPRDVMAHPDGHLMSERFVTQTRSSYETSIDAFLFPLFSRYVLGAPPGHRLDIRRIQSIP